MVACGAVVDSRPVSPSLVHLLLRGNWRCRSGVGLRSPAHLQRFRCRDKLRHCNCGAQRLRPRDSRCAWRPSAGRFGDAWTMMSLEWKQIHELQFRYTYICAGN